MVHTDMKQKYFDFLKSLAFNEPIRLKIISSSMVPSLRVGDTVTVLRKKMSHVKNQEVIAFFNPVVKRLIVHRVKKQRVVKNIHYLITKGDNEIHEDSFLVSEKYYLGRVLVCNKKRIPLLQKIYVIISRFFQ